MGGGIYPEGWELSTVEFIAKFIDYRGRTPTKTPNGIPLITAKNIRDGYINREPREYISESNYDDWMTRGIPKAGDVVITTEAPMGNVALVDISEKFALAQRAICLQCYKPEVGRFLHYALRSPTFQKNLTMNATGTTVSGIKAATLKSLSIPIPSSAEQKEIADRLDTLLAQVEATQAHLARIPDIIKRFRQSVLAAAIRGRLTLNMNVEFERLTINSVCNAAFDGPFGSKLKSSDYTSDGVRVIRLENIGHLEFLSDKKTYISKEKYSELKKNEIMNNDVLFSSFVDQEVRTCLFDAIDDIYINKADCFCLRPDQKKSTQSIFRLYWQVELHMSRLKKKFKESLDQE